MQDTNAGAGFRGRRGRPGPERQSVRELFEKQPPASIEAEMSLLGSMILDPAVIGDVISVVKGHEDFYQERHGHIYRAIVDVFDLHHTGDLVQILDSLRDRKVLDLCGGADYLAELADAVPTSVNAPHFARIVAEKAKLRRLIDAASQILYDAYHVGDLGPDGAREVLDRAEMSVFEIAQETQSTDPQALADLLQLEMQRIESEDFEGGALTGLQTGFAELDELLRGMQPGELLILAARPSMGKTALATNLAEQIALGGVPVAGAPPTRRHPVAIFSLEMSKTALVQRLLSARSGVASTMLRGGQRIPDADLRRLMLAAEDLKNAPILIDDTPGLSILNLRARARRMVAQQGVKCIFIDYLQLMSAPSAARESRQVEVSAISRGVKALARELNVPIVCLSQLNRASEQREGNRPRMADLRESGSIEQDADVILLLHREEYYHLQNPDWALENPDKVGVAELIVAKQRNGPTGVVRLRWDSGSTRFRNLDSFSRPPADFDLPNSPMHKARGYEPAPFEAANPFENAPRGPAPGEGSPPPRQAFSPGKKTGPISDHRDGGGPDRSAGPDDLGDLPI